MRLCVSLSVSACLSLLGAAVGCSSAAPASPGFSSGAGSTSGTSPSGASGKSASSGASGSASSGASGSASSGASGSASSGASGGSGTTSGSAAGSGSGSGSSTPASLAGPPAGPYTVSGPKILDKNGHPHLFRGLDRPSLEWSCSGDIKTDEYQAMTSPPWAATNGPNVLRLSLNQDCWLNDPANPTYNFGLTSPDTYESIVDGQVQAAIAAGLDVILDLHWSDQGNYSVGAACQPEGLGNCQQDMADAHSILFWQQVATKYANNPSILFELYNEPKIGGYMPAAGDWNTWLNGGTSSGFAVHGMQELYTTVRATGANNLVIIGGLAWAYDLSGVPSHTVNGTGIIYNTHPYLSSSNSNPSGWSQYFGSLTATYPVIATEFGDTTATQATGCNATFDTTFTEYANGQASGNNPANEMSWTAWAFYNSDCKFPSLLADSNYTPNGPGTVVANALKMGP